MEGIIVLILLGGIGFLWLRRDPKEYKRRLKEKKRTKNQKIALRYFLVNGCLKKTVKDEKIDELLSEHIASLNIRQKAINKIGLDETEIKEIDPVRFEHYVFSGATYMKEGKDGIWRSSKYQISWLFFSASQVYFYRNSFDLCEDGKKEETDEFFYKDITGFSTATEKRNKYVEDTEFVLVVPGTKFGCVMENNEQNERAVQGMKSLLREKKSQ